METVTLSAGFGHPHALRRHFRKRIGISPTGNRVQFPAQSGQLPRMFLTDGVLNVGH